MIEKELIEFLIEAKKQTYANSNAPKEASSRLDSHDYEYSNGKLTYHDILVELNLWEKKLYMVMILHHFGE